MSFLAPLFLLGVLAVAGPVIFHLIRRTTRQREVFSSLMFLQPTPPRLTRRSRLEHILLLLLRCLVLCLLAAGFARPFLKQAVSSTPPDAAARRVVILLDVSASMRRGNLWTEARNRADAIVRDASPRDEFALVTFDRQTHSLVTFEQWKATPSGQRSALISTMLTETSPGWAATRSGNALVSAAEMLADSGGKSATAIAAGQIVLITDLQEGSHLESLQGYEWPKGITLSVEVVKARSTSNAALQLLGDADEADPKARAAVRVRVANSTDSKKEQFQVGWANSADGAFLGKPIEIYVPPGQSRIVPVPAPVADASPDRIKLKGDEDDFDNTVFVTPPAKAQLNIYYFGDESPRDTKQPLFFLERALQETRDQSIKITVCPPDAPTPAVPESSGSLFVVTSALPNEKAQALHEQAAAGRVVLCTPKTDAAGATLARILGVTGQPLTEARPENYAMLADIDFRNPLFAHFADPRFSDFTKIHFWKYRRLDASSLPQARIVARFDTGDPAVVEVPVGKGIVYVLTSGWHPEDSQLALSTKFVPLLFSVLDQTGGASPPPVQYQVGDVVPLASLAGANPSAFTIRLPDGTRTNLPSGDTNFLQTGTPGIYSLESAQPPRQFAVNLDPTESRTAPLSVDELERLGAPLGKASSQLAAEAERKINLQNTELENRQKLWRWLILAALAALLFETWLAGRTARRLSTTEQVG
jgi:hypothetical protein